MINYLTKEVLTQIYILPDADALLLLDSIAAANNESASDTKTSNLNKSTTLQKIKTIIRESNLDNYTEVGKKVAKMLVQDMKLGSTAKETHGIQDKGTGEKPVDIEVEKNSGFLKKNHLNVLTGIEIDALLRVGIENYDALNLKDMKSKTKWWFFNLASHKIKILNILENTR